MGLGAESGHARPTVVVLDPHWLAVSFEPQYPHGRHTQNPLPGDSSVLPVHEAQTIRGQAGQSSDDARGLAEFRIKPDEPFPPAGTNRVGCCRRSSGMTGTHRFTPNPVSSP